MSLVPSSPFGKTSRRVSMRTISQSTKSIAGWYGTPAHDANRSSRAPHVEEPANRRPIVAFDELAW